MAFVSSNWQKLRAKKRLRSPIVRAPLPSVETTSSANDETNNNNNNKRMKKSSSTTTSAAAAAITHHLAMDCEFVGVGDDSKEHALARCSIVNFNGDVVYDKFVRVNEKVTDFRTAVSGIRPVNLRSTDAVSYDECQKEVAKLLEGRVLVGHSIHSDLKVLRLAHPRKHIRDTAKYKAICPKKPRSLKKLLKEHLGLEIQSGEHNSVEDARAVMALYKHLRTDWEKSLLHPHHNKQQKDNEGDDDDDDNDDEATKKRKRLSKVTKHNKPSLLNESKNRKKMKRKNNLK